MSDQDVAREGLNDALEAIAEQEYHGVTCSHPHNLPYNDECAVWWLRGTPEWRLAHTNLGDAR